MKNSSLRSISKRLSLNPSCKTGGFTLMEMLVVIIMAGVIATIAAPGWLAYLERRRLVSAQDTVFQEMLQTQGKAQQTATPWRFGLRTQGNITEWAIYPASVTDPTTVTTWEALDSFIEIDTTNTTVTEEPASSGVYAIRYNQKGNPDVSSVKFTLKSSSGSDARRCVEISTLTGALRKLDECS